MNQDTKQMLDEYTLPQLVGLYSDFHKDVRGHRPYTHLAVLQFNFYEQEVREEIYKAYDALNAELQDIAKTQAGRTELIANGWIPLWD